MKPKHPIQIEIETKIRSQHKEQSTADAYWGWVNRYLAFCKSSKIGKETSAEDAVTRFLSRLASPIRIEGNAVLALCLGRQENRTFSFDGIANVELVSADEVLMHPAQLYHILNDPDLKEPNIMHGLPTLIRRNELASKTYTPGPWRIGRTGVCASVVSDTSVPDVNGSGEVDFYGGHLICESVSLRNAPLIAAAPELLEELKEAISFIQRCTDWRGEDPRIEEMRAAIAKATSQCPT